MAEAESKKSASQPKPKAGAAKKTEWTGKKLGRFTLGGLLGRGAMGAVFLAEDPDLRRQVALKVLPQKIKTKKDEEQVDTFIREARSAARIEHPAVVRVYEIGRDRGYVFIAMEYLRGGDFQEIVKERGLFERHKACEYASQAADALGYAHKHGVIHRDIKPSNLMLTHNNQCKLVDFGLAFLEDPGTIDSLKGKIVGTPMYLAPEILKGEEATSLSDIYSLGAVLWFMLTGRPPFVGNSLREVRDLQDAWEMPDLKELLPDAPAGLVNILYRAVAKRPKERFKDASEFSMMLQSHSVPGGMVIPGVGKIPVANVSKSRVAEAKPGDSKSDTRYDEQELSKSGSLPRPEIPDTDTGDDEQEIRPDDIVEEEKVSWRDMEAAMVRPGPGPSGTLADENPSDPGSIALEQLSSVASMERSHVSGAHSVVRKREPSSGGGGKGVILIVLAVIAILLGAVGAYLYSQGVFDKFLGGSDDLPVQPEGEGDGEEGEFYTPGAAEESAGAAPAIQGGGKLLPNDPHGSPSIVLDDADPVGIHATPGWLAETDAAKAFGETYRHDDGSSKGQLRVRFYPQLTRSGFYRVYLWAPNHPNAATDVPVDISSPRGQERVRIDLAAKPGQWHLIGQWYFNEGATGSLTISNTGTEGVVLVDAVKFVFDRAADGGVG